MSNYPWNTPVSWQLGGWPTLDPLTDFFPEDRLCQLWAENVPEGMWQPRLVDEFRFVCFPLLWARCEVGPSIPNSRLQTERGELGADKKLDPFRLLESAGHIQSASSHFHAADFQNRRQSVCSKAHDVNHPPLRVRVKNQLPQMCVFMKTPLSQPFSCESLRDFLRQGSPTDAPIFLLRQRSLLF